MDGFSSHVNVISALPVFSDHKIFVVKEEGDTLAVNQAYDQSVAKADKAQIRELLDTVHHKLSVITQSDLIAICCKVLKNVMHAAWISSFKKVNLHPDFHVLCVEWLRCIDDKIETGEKFFTEHWHGLFDVMPAVWKNISVEACHKCINMIDSFHRDAEPEATVWTKEYVRKLVKYAPLDNIPKIHVSYMVAKCDPSIFIADDNGFPNASTDVEDVQAKEGHLTSFHGHCGNLYQSLNHTRTTKNALHGRGLFFNT